MSTAVDARDLFRVHRTPEGDAAALQGLTVAVAEGEIVTILGPSGSGKTSLLRIIAGLDRPSAGSARVYGLELGRASRRAVGAHRAATVGYVEQHYARTLAPELTARELVVLRLTLGGAGRRERTARANELLDAVGLLPKAAARPRDLSGGEQQRIAVCAALAHRPRLLLADEPTGELDAANAAAVYELIERLARDHGCTALIVSHDPASTTIADRTVHIRDGRVSEEASTPGPGGELIVVGRGGWLRVPDDLLQRAGIGSHARARLEDGNVLLAGVAEDTPPTGPKPPAALGLMPAREQASGVELVEVTMVYGREPTAVRVLERLNASFPPARFHVVTGPSGSGKTTLLQLVAGLELPTSGEVMVLGRALSGLDREARALLRCRHVGIVSQQSRILPFLSAQENIELGIANRPDPGDLRERAIAALSLVGLTERREHRVSTLSSGEQARVLIARAIAARPALLLADEPTSRLDRANSVALASLLRRIADLGVTVICATHDPLLIEQADNELALAPLSTARPPLRRALEQQLEPG
ncbi:MAG TPA: ATP-binding cassette domain-containing protein [Gaiellaceae bacterium]|nr:ATP-binding cassette domain-containing protein [Gaiellaceae bacterium]